MRERPAAWRPSPWVLRLCVMAGAVALLLPAGATAQTATATMARQLVMPFENSSTDPRAHWLTEASAVIITDDLLALGVPAIPRDDRLRAFERLRVPPVANLSHATVIKIGQILGAADVIVGRVDLDADRLTVRARTIRFDAGRMSEEIVEEGPLEDLFAIYARVARRIVPEPTVTLEEMEEDHPNPAAFEQYIKGLLAQAPPARVTYLTAALRLAPDFRRPRVALWAVHHDLGDHAAALAAVRAIPPGHRLSRQAQFLETVSMLYLGRYQEAFDRLSALNESGQDPALLNNLGIIQLRRPASGTGGRAVSYFGEAVKLDGGEPDLYFNLGYAYWLDRETSSAISWLREAVRRNPADAEAHYVLGVALQASGSAAEGSREKELAKRLSTELAEFDARGGGLAAPRELERVRTDIDVPPALRLETTLVEAGQRDQQALATFHLEAGRRFFATARDAEAIAALRRAVYLAPYQSEAHLLLGRLYLRGGRLGEAIDALKISVWSEDTIPARLALAEAYLASRDEAGARAELEFVLGRDAGNEDARRLLDRLP